MSASVLIVDDDPEGVRLVASTVATRGYEVRMASDAESAMGAMRARCPGLVITEPEMPGMDGIELFCVPSKLTWRRSFDRHARDGRRLACWCWIWIV